MQLFQLKSIEITGDKNSNGGYRVWNDDLGLFDSREKAEDAMRQAIREMQGTRFLGFLICERELNSPCLYGEGNQAITTYLADGTLFCHSFCDDACEKPFKGRPAESIKFKSGELAWYWRGDRIEPCLVDLLPYSEEKYAEYCRKRGHSPDDPDFFPFDYSDDCYLVYDYNNDHNHPRCYELFPFNDTITRRNRDRLLATKKWWEDGCPR